MSFPRIPDVSSGIGSAETPKDLNGWHSKREVFHNLFICQGKTLDDVKTIMESDYGFPKTLKRSDYEYVLREEFKFRKNLSADEWRLCIGPHIARRKADGKRSEVFLNGSKVQNVGRRIQRSLHSRRSHRRANARTAALPHGVVIRTPSPQPSIFVAPPTFGRRRRAHGIEGHQRYQSNMDGFAGSPVELDWLNVLTGVIPLSDAGCEATIVLSAQLLREGCPINELLAMLNECQRKFNRVDLRLFGPNATISILGKMCFDFSNNLQEETISPGEMISILDWIGFTVDIAPLKTFFSQKILTVLAVWEALNSTVFNWRHLAAFDVLLSINLSIMDRAPWTTGKPYHNFSYCVKMAPNRVATLIDAYPCNQCELDEALQIAVYDKGPIELVKQLVSAGASLTNKDSRTSVDNLIRYFGSSRCEAVDLALLETLLGAGAVVDELPPHTRGMDWSRPRHPSHATDYMLLSGGHSTHNHGLWLLVSSHSYRQHTTVTVPGIFGAAQNGQEKLLCYLNARSKPYEDQDRKQILEVALSEASERGFSNVVQSLVQLGVDPNVRMLPQFHVDSQGIRHRNVWHPVIRAVNSGEVDTLRILVTASSIELALLDQQAGTQLDMCALRNMENSRRDQILRLLSTLDLATATRSDILLYAIKPHICGNGHSDSEFGLANQLLELGVACLDSREHLDGATPHILVRAIRNDCGIGALNNLIERNVEVLSALSASTIQAVLEATLKLQVHDGRHAILEFLARNIEGLESHIQRNGSSLLIHFLENTSCCRRGYDHTLQNWKNECEAMATVKWFMDLGARFAGPVLAKLIEHANESLMLAIIHGVADENAVDNCNALKRSIDLGRLNLAVALIEKGAHVNDSRACGGHTALRHACESNAPVWFIRLLVDKGADVNALSPSNNRLTALQAACANGAQLSCISFLLEKGAHVNAAPALEGGLTALQYGARRGLMNVVGLLLDHGADVNALSGFLPYDPPLNFIRAIDIAALHSRLDMVHFLITAGARSCQLGLTGFEGAIEIATRERNFATARLLREHADSCSRDPMEAERRWLQANSHACLWNGRIQDAGWVAFVKREDKEGTSTFDKYLKEELNWEFPGLECGRP